MSRKHGAGSFNNWRQPMSAKDVFVNICLVLKGSFSFIFDQTVLDYLRTRSFSHLSGRKNLEGKSSSTSYKVLSSILDGLWQHQLPNFEMEQAFTGLFFIICWYSRQTDKQPDRQTDRQLDREVVITSQGNEGYKIVVDSETWLLSLL